MFSPTYTDLIGNLFSLSQAFILCFLTQGRDACSYDKVNPSNLFTPELRKQARLIPPAGMRTVYQKTPTAPPSVWSTNCDCIYFSSLLSPSLEDQGASPVNRPSVGCYSGTGKRKARGKKKKGTISANIAGTKYEIGTVQLNTQTTVQRGFCHVVLIDRT